MTGNWYDLPIISWKHWTKAGTVALEVASAPGVNIWFEGVRIGWASHPQSAAESLANGAFDAAFAASGFPPPSSLGIPPDVAEWDRARMPPEWFRGMPDC